MAWAKRHTCCRYCHTTDLKHKGRGLCTFCHREMWRYVSGPKQDHEMAKFFSDIYNNHVTHWRNDV